MTVAANAVKAALVVWVALLLPVRPAMAQAWVGVEATHDRAVWHFDNASAFDTADLVPHFFEQDHTLDNVWLTGGVSYRAGADWQTTLGITPTRQARATDYDTFFNPGGITWVAGTAGDARVGSLRFSQSVELGRTRTVRWHGGYRLRVDRANFLDGDRTTTRNGVLVERTTVTTREYTHGQLHEFFAGADRTWALSSGWQLALTGELTPTAINRLAIELPDKYPGRTLVFQTTTLATGAGVALTRGTGRWPVTIRIDASRSWRYSRTQWVQRRSLALGVSLGRTS
ncbi:MAG: hypothetical protein JSU08_11140 [Acidobacteria bacterium]|nr:hypothetical protein [Acidobacteriota bacterium]